MSEGQPQFPKTGAKTHCRQRARKPPGVPEVVLSHDGERTLATPLGLSALRQIGAHGPLQRNQLHHSESALGKRSEFTNRATLIRMSVLCPIDSSKTPFRRTAVGLRCLDGVVRWSRIQQGAGLPGRDIRAIAKKSRPTMSREPRDLYREPLNSLRGDRARATPTGLCSSPGLARNAPTLGLDQILTQLCKSCHGHPANDRSTQRLDPSLVMAPHRLSYATPRLGGVPIGTDSERAPRRQAERMARSLF